jgi:molybdopterin/thiamine biosynthesis adenylyltransferase
MTDETQKSDIQSEIHRQSEFIITDAGLELRVLFEQRAMDLAGRFGCPLRKIYDLAMTRDILPYRYLRNQGVLGTPDQLKLCRSCVAVVGAGGLGGYAATLMARTGIGALILIDPDIFKESNLNRQCFAVTETLDMPKVSAAASRIYAINPAVEVTGYSEALTSENGSELLKGATLAVDALDNIPSRLSLQAACETLGIPMVHGAIAGFEGQVLTIWPGAAGLKHLYESDSPETPAPESVMGVPAVTPLIIAGLQVMEVIKLLLNRGTALTDTMLYADLEAASLEKFRFGGPGE